MFQYINAFSYKLWRYLNVIFVQGAALSSTHLTLIGDIIACSIKMRRSCKFQSGNFCAKHCRPTLIALSTLLHLGLGVAIRELLTALPSPSAQTIII